MTGRRRSRRPGSLVKSAAAKARADKQNAQRLALAEGEMDELGLAYGRIRSQARKAAKAGRGGQASATVRATIRQLDSAANELERMRR